ncbi:heterokaryon incompatibility protein [Colletotrichum musicola]|uniref:Heterokaryon incompatibility protein n=1 Tax=Colletotrichum musicola TaxID=2175873 RepID=A0A8H6KJL1_9PEZI|nr:heterokaryon incompatibility protein [Colletotrichum musicola]
MKTMSLHNRLSTIFELGRRLYLFDQEGSGEGSMKDSKQWERVPSPLDVLDILRKLYHLIRGHSPPPYGMKKWQRVVKLIAAMSLSNFTDPRDRVFGCLGLIKVIVPGADLSSVLPDYTISIAELLTSLGCLLYENIYELEYLLCLAGSGPTSIIDLPSWAPDFTRINGRRVRFIGLGNRSNLEGGMNASNFFPVSKRQAELDLNDKTPVLSGVRLGVAGEPVASKQPRNFDAEWLLDYCSQDEFYPHGPESKAQKRPQAVILTLSIDNIHTARQRHQSERSRPGDAAGHVASTAREWYLLVLAITLNRGLILESSLTAKLAPAAALHPDWLPTPGEVQVLAAETKIGGDEDDEYDLETLRQNAWDHGVTGYTKERRLFLTDGGLLCLGPQEVERGDEVWIVRGSRVPMLLRKAEETEESYRLVGETYVHGAMYGEAVTEEVERQFAPVRLV